MSESRKSSSTQERILLAAIQCYDQIGIENTSLEQVASSAGVGRSTVYRYAKNRRELLHKVLLRDADHALAELEVATRYYDNLEQVVVESILFLMRRRNSYDMQHILYGDGEEASGGAGLSIETLSQLAAASLQNHFDKAAAKQQVPQGMTLPVLADWVGRITISLHSQPSQFTETDAGLRTYLAVVLSPLFYICDKPCEQRRTSA